MILENLVKRWSPIAFNVSIVFNLNRTRSTYEDHTRKVKGCDCFACARDHRGVIMFEFLRAKHSSNATYLNRDKRVYGIAILVRFEASKRNRPIQTGGFLRFLDRCTMDIDRLKRLTCLYGATIAMNIDLSYVRGIWGRLLAGTRFLGCWRWKGESTRVFHVWVFILQVENT